MGRPPILSRPKVAEAALKIIDERGLDALSLERLAGELGVRGPSLYHHFPDKAAILSEVAQRVLGDVAADHETDSWQEWMVEVGLSFYRKVLEHPNAAAILMEYLPDTSSIGGFGMAARVLTEAGVDPELQMLAMEGCEKLVWGWALQHAFMASDGKPSHPELEIGEEWPELATAFERGSARWSGEEMLEAAMYSFLAGAIASTSAASTDRS